MPKTIETTVVRGNYDPDDPQRFINEAEDTDIFEQVARQLESERAEHPVDPYYARRSQTWARLAHQVVGQESV